MNFVNVTTANPDAEAQVAAVENAITQEVNAIIVGAANSRASAMRSTRRRPRVLR